MAMATKLTLKNKHLNLVIIASSLHSLFLMEQAANGLVEPPLK